MFGVLLKKRVCFFIIPVLISGIALLILLGGDSSVALTAAERSYLASKKKIIFISQTTYPPFEFVDRNNRRQGMCLEIASWIGQEFGFRVQFRDTTFQKAQQALLSNKADVLTSFFYSKKRDKIFDFTQIMFRIPASIFVQSERPDIQGVWQLRGKRVAIQKGDYAREYLKNKAITFIDIPCDSFEEATKLLIRGKADAIIGDEQIVLYYLYSSGMIEKVKRVGKPLYVGKNCMGLREGEAILRSILNKGILLARKRGVFKRINLKWTGSFFSSTTSWIDLHRDQIFLILIILAGTSILIGFWNLQLQHKVKVRTRALAASEDKYRTLFETAQYAVVIYDTDGHILDANAEFLDIYGAVDKESARRLDLLHDLTAKDQEAPEFHQAWLDVADEKVKEFEWPAMRVDNGIQFEVQVHLKRVVYGKREGILATIKDITIQKQTERELLQAQKMEAVGNLAGGLAHDFNNILGGIVGPVSLLQHSYQSGDPMDQEKMLEFLEMIAESGQRAADVVTQLLSLSSRQNFSFRKMDLVSSIQRVVDLSRISFDKSIELDIHLPERSANIKGDPTQIEQVLLNLFLNAAHAMTIMRDPADRWQGILTILLAEAAGDSLFLQQHPKRTATRYWALSISDTGVGINQNFMGYIFDPFFSTKDKGVGSGLGLSMAFNIIDQHGGMIDVISEPGTGSVFTLYFPVFESEAVMAEPRVERDHEKGEGQILIIDDEAILLEVTRAMLTECGYRVLSSSNGKKGLDIFRKRHHEIDAVLLDMVMPGMSGKEVFEELKEIDPDVKVLLASGFRQDERVRAVLRMGADGFIHKPYSLKELSHALARVVLNKG